MAGEFAYCDKCKAEREVLRSVEDPSDKDRKFITLVCGHTIRKMVKVANMDKVVISDKASWLILKDPVAEIQKAVNDKDYFKTVAYACAIFEYCGLQNLVWHSKKTGNPLIMKKKKNKKKKEKKKDEWTLSRIIDELFNREIITDTDATKLHCIRHLRNSFVHEDYSFKLSSGIAEKVNASIEDIINYTALLKAEYDKYGK
jgi:NACalpha-BTF3-like transcription factor